MYFKQRECGTGSVGMDIKNPEREKGNGEATKLQVMQGSCS